MTSALQLRYMLAAERVKTAGLFPPPPEKKEPDYEPAALVGGLGALGTLAMPEGASRVLGYQPIFHGTTAQAAAEIARTGIDPTFGGTGGAAAAIQDPKYIEHSKGHVHVTTDSGRAQRYATIAQTARDAAEEGKTKTPSDLFMSAMGPRRGKVVGGHIPFSEFLSNFHADPDSEELLGREKSFRSAKSIPPQRLNKGIGDLAKERVLNPKGWLKDVKVSPKKAMGGAAMIAAPLALLGGAGLMAKREHEKYKRAFATNAFSGPMNPNIQSGASYLPPSKVPSLRAPIEKRALIERLVRLGATDIPGTPRLAMRQRSPEELAALQHGVTGAFNRFSDPAKEAVGRLIGKVPHEGTQKVLRAGAHALIDHPETIPMSAIPLPGLTPAWIGAKRGLEKVIDRVSPLPTKIAASAPTRGGFFMASDIPPFRAPSLKAPLEKAGDMLPDYVTYNQGDFTPAKLVGKSKTSAGQNEGIDENARGSAPEDFKKISGSSPFQAAQTAKTIGTPKITPPGPSIADLSKPKGAGFGTGIAGAFKSNTGIGGTAPVSLKANPGAPR
jgi:hypothetical protein